MNGNAVFEFFKPCFIRRLYTFTVESLSQLGFQFHRLAVTSVGNDNKITSERTDISGHGGPCYGVRQEKTQKWPDNQNWTKLQFNHITVSKSSILLLFHHIFLNSFFFVSNNPYVWWTTAVTLGWTRRAEPQSSCSKQCCMFFLWNSGKLQPKLSLG